MWHEHKKEPLQQSLTDTLIYSIRNSQENWAISKIPNGYRCIHAKFTFTIKSQYECHHGMDDWTEYTVDYDEDATDSKLETLYKVAKQYVDDIATNEKKEKNLKIALSISTYDLKN